MLAGTATDRETRENGKNTTLFFLQNGDHLTAQEFLRRYEAMPDLKKAELVEGVVYMGSPVSVKHAEADGIVHGWLLNYAARTPGANFVPNATVLLDSEDIIQPDALLRWLPEQGGKTRETSKGLLAGPPELIVEIALSSASLDLHDKLRACQRAGVGEYIVWVVAREEIKWFVLEEEVYVQQQPDARGLLSSRNFPGLVLPVKSLLRLDAAAVLDALEAARKPRSRRAAGKSAALRRR